MKLRSVILVVTLSCLPFLAIADNSNLCAQYSHFHGYFKDSGNKNSFRFTSSDDKNISGIFTHSYGSQDGQYTNVSGTCNGNQLSFTGTNGSMSVEFNGVLNYDGIDHVLSIYNPQVTIDGRNEYVPIMVYYRE